MKKDKSLLKRLTEYKSTMTPFHMPGHKRVFNKNSLIPYEIDITEVDGFDNLHNMEGVLKETAMLASELFGSIFSFPLVNGSTCGILAGIYSLSRENKNILIARNCHKSVYNAAEILNLNTHYIMPDIDEYGVFVQMSPDDIEESIIENDIGLVVVTSPSYEGVISDISAIYEVCKKHNAYLLLDCAHGAHLSFYDEKNNPLPYCDICVMSLHKTLPALTQTAVLNVCSRRVDENLVNHALSVFETSSPSYILLASIDECLRYIKYNRSDFEKSKLLLKQFYKDTKALQNLKVFHYDDLCKIIIASNDGSHLAKMLRKEKIEIEMASSDYVVLIATVSDTKKSLNILKKALFKIDKNFPPFKKGCLSYPKICDKVLSATDAQKEKGEFLDFTECENRISLEYIWAYPPGIPVVVPGEKISRDLINYLSTRKDFISTKGSFPKIYVK